MDPALRPHFDAAWVQVKRIVQVRHGKQHRPVNLSFKAVKNLAYRAITGVPHFAPSTAVGSNWEEAPMVGEDMGVYTMIATEWVRMALQEGCWFSLDREHGVPTFFRCAWVTSPYLKWARSHRKAISPKVFRASLAMHEAVPGPAAGAVAVGADGWDVFPALEEPSVWEVLKLAPLHAWLRPLTKWTPGPSHIPGCVRPEQPASVAAAFTSQNTIGGMLEAPLLTILRRLKNSGWALQPNGEPLTVLTDATPGYLSQAKLQQRQKPYFVAIAMLPDLFRRGLTRLEHGLSDGYYRALLAAEGPDELERRQRAGYYRNILEDRGEVGLATAIEAGGEDGDAAADDFDVVAHAAPAHALAPPAPAAPGMIVSDDEPSPDGAAGMVVSESDEAPLPPPAVPAEAMGDHGAVGDADEWAIPDDLPEIFVVDDYVIQLRRLHASRSDGPREHVRYELKCPVHGDRTFTSGERGDAR